MSDCKLNIIHHGERFATYEDAQAFSKTRHLCLCVPRYIRLPDGDGYKFVVNPAWIDAPYEEVIVQQ